LIKKQKPERRFLLFLACRQRCSVPEVRQRDSPDVALFLAAILNPVLHLLANTQWIYPPAADRVSALAADPMIPVVA
jgi:hypothetical protein